MKIVLQLNVYHLDFHHQRSILLNLKLLKVCQKLKSLLLIISNFDEDEEKILENGEELLKALAKSAPTNLREIRFFNDFKFSLKALEEFLEKWKDRPALSILTSDPIYQGDDYKN